MLAPMTCHSPRHDLDNWLDRHGYRHEHALKPKASHLKGAAAPVTIVVAWTEDTQELAPGQKSWRHDLGERPNP